MFKKLSALFLIVAMLIVIGCASHVHKVGAGAQGWDITTARQWYVLWGIVPINQVDTQAMAAGATNYHITTMYTPVDALISVVMNIVTINCRTVQVRK